MKKLKKGKKRKVNKDKMGKTEKRMKLKKTPDIYPMLIFPKRNTPDTKIFIITNN